MAMNVKLTDTSQERETWRHVQCGALAEPFVEVNKVLTHDVVQDQDHFEPIKVGENPVDNVVHVLLSVTHHEC